MYARVPVPWGPEPKAQIVSGLSGRHVFVNPDAEKPIRRAFEDLFEQSLNLFFLVRNPPVPLALRKYISVQAPTIVRASIKALAPRETRTAVTARPSLSAALLPQFQRLEWGSYEPESLPPPSRPRSVVSTLPEEETFWADLPAPKRKRMERKLRDFAEIGVMAEIRTIEPVLPSSLTLRKTDWTKLPPELAKWAVQRGIREAEAPAAYRSAVTAYEKQQVVFERLARGEWCRVSDLDIFPPRLERWLKDCDVKLIRKLGAGQIVAAPATPVNGYVTEDGTVFYVTEDNSTFYVQET